MQQQGGHTKAALLSTAPMLLVTMLAKIGMLLRIIFAEIAVRKALPMTSREIQVIAVVVVVVVVAAVVAAVVVAVSSPSLS